MEAVKKVRNNFISLIGGEIFSRILGVVLFIILARYLGPEDFGIYSLALSFYMIFSLISNAGLSTLLVKDVAREKEIASKYIGSIIVIKSILSIACIILLMFLVWILDYPFKTTLAILIYSIALIFSSHMETFSSLFRAYEVMQYSSLINILRSIIGFSLVLTAVYMHLGLLEIAGAQVLSFVIVFFIFLYFTNKRFVTIKPLFDGMLIKRLLLGALPFLMTGTVSIINAKVDVVMLSKLGSESMVGLYSAANELIFTLYVIPNLLSTAIFPVISRKSKESINSIAEMCNLSSKILITLGVPMGIGILILSPQIIHLIYGQHFIDSIIVLQILSITVILTFSRAVFSWALTAIDKVNLALIEYIICLVINIVLNTFLIPRYGLIGVSITNIIVAVFGNVFLLYMLNRYIKGISIIKSYVKPIAASGIMAASIIQISRYNLFMIITAGMLIYLFLVLLLKMFNQKEISILIEALPFRFGKMAKALTGRLPPASPGRPGAGAQRPARQTGARGGPGSRPGDPG